jgi:hypothetical protein
VLLADRRERRRHSTLLPWAALVAGTVASLAANVAVGPPDLVGRAISGWPALALLVTLKLLADRLGGGPVRSVRGSGRPWWTGLLPVVRRRSRDPGWSAAPERRSGGGSVPVRNGSGGATGPDVADLLPVSRRVRDELAARGERVTRRTLVAALRAAGRSVSNERAGQLVRVLNSEPPTAVNGHRPRQQHLLDRDAVP